MQRLEMSSTSAIDVLTTLCAFARISVGEASRRLRQLLVLGTLLTGSNAAIAAAPTFSWDNNSPPGQSGAGYPSWNAALSAAMASSQAGDVTSQDGCSLGPVSGAFPSWSIIMVGCADIRISAVCPAGAVFGSSQSCVVSEGLPDPQKNVVPDEEPAKRCSDGNPIDSAQGDKHQIEHDYVGLGPFPLVVERRYGSLVPTSSAHGRQWRHYYARSIVPSSDGQRVYRFSRSGQVVEFTQAGSSWVAFG